MDVQSLQNPVSQPGHKAALRFGFTDPEVKSKSASQQGEPALSSKGSRPRGRARKCYRAVFPRPKRKGICDPWPRSFPLYSRSQIIRKANKSMYAYRLTSKSGFEFFTLNSSYYRTRPLNPNFQMQHSILFSFHDLFMLHLMLNTTDILVELITHKAI